MCASKSSPGVDIHFSQVFDVDPEELKKYSAFDISLVNDLPLFVDPFLLFASKLGADRALHDRMMQYLAFLRDKAVAGSVPGGLLREWFYFKEVPNNWLGFSRAGNRGHGLGRKFALSLERNLRTVFESFGEDPIAEGAHLEKLSLVDPGVGRDTISDFTVNLIKDFLLEYTQEFALRHVDPSKRAEFAVRRVAFDYSLESWTSANYVLPHFDGEYVLLTPRRLLTRDRTWISRPDLLDNLRTIVESVDDEQLRAKLNNYLLRHLPEVPTRDDRSRVMGDMIRRYPALADWFIRSREQNAEGAFRRATRKVQHSEKLFVEQTNALSALLQRTPFYELAPDTHDDARRRALFLKDVIENKGGWRVMYVDGEPLKREEDVHILYRLTWYGTRHDVSREVNDGRGPADFKISQGASDKTIVEFKLARNSKLQQNLERQAEVYKRASDAEAAVKVIVVFTEGEQAKVDSILRDLDLVGTPDIVVIDARSDNKPSGSRA